MPLIAQDDPDSTTDVDGYDEDEFPSVDSTVSDGPIALSTDRGARPSSPTADFQGHTPPPFGDVSIPSAPSIQALRYVPGYTGYEIAKMREAVPWDRLARHADVTNAYSSGYGSQTVPIYSNRVSQIAGLGLTALGAIFAPYTGGASLAASQAARYAMT